MRKLSLLSVIGIIAGNNSHFKTMQRFILALLLCFMGYSGFGAVVVTPGSGGLSICSNSAATGIAPGFTTLGTITVTEGSNADFVTGADQIVLHPPTGWQFNTGSTPVLAFAGGGNISAITSGGITGVTFTINITSGGTTLPDAITISGLQLQATTTSAASGYVYASSSTNVAGITTGSSGSNFGDLSLLTALTPSVSIAAVPSGTICSGTSVTFTPTPVNGGTPSYQWLVNGILVASGSSFTSSTLANGNTVVCTMIPTGCAAPASVNSSTTTMSVNALPTAVTASGSGTFCGSTTITAANGGSGTIYFQGTTSGGTSTAIASSSQSVSASGTYYFRAQSAGGCWGTEGSVTVTINPLPTAVTASGAGAFCGSTTVTAANGGSGTIYFQGTTTGGTSTATPSISQTVSSTGTYYFRAQSAAGCWGTEGSANVTINALPTTVVASGGGTFCGSTTITAANGGSGTIYFQGATSGGTSTATPSASQVISTSGTYYFRAQSAAGCWGNEGSVTVTINPNPAVYTVTGTGSYCSGGSGIDINLSNSQVGVNYTLLRGGVSTGIVLAGTGSFLDFGFQTVAGTYTVTGANAVSGCTVTMSGSGVVTVNVLPTAFTVTGGGGYCAGGAGTAVGLSGSTVGINYQLYVGGVATGSLVPGTGAAISFGLQTAIGTYTVVGINATTGCTNNMTSSVTIFTNAVPAIFTVTGGGTYCSGGSGVVVGLSGSTAGVNYQLYVGGVPTGSAVAGTGAAISFGFQTSGGTYTVIATNASTGCTSTMGSSAVVTVNAAPVAFSVTGGGAYCSGGTGVAVGLSSSALGFNYQLYVGGSPVGGTVAGTNAALSFGLQTTGGVYTVIATNGLTGCTATMTGSATVTVNALPGLFTVTGGGAYCSGGTGVNVGISGSAAGVNYQLFRGGVAVGSAVAGTGASFNFGLQTTAGTYTIVATTAATGCTNNMTGSVSVSINALPTLYSVTGGGGYCTGGTGVSVGLANSDLGFNYQLFRGGVPVGSALPGIGSSLDFGLQTTAGVYTIVATNATTLCTNTMTGSATVVANALPTAFAVTGGGAYCIGGTGVAVGLGNSVAGVTYQLYVGGVATGTAVAGSGAAISFGLQTTTGIYTVIATTTATSCTNNMTGSVTVSTNPLPALFTVTGGGAYCSGGSGVTIGLSSSVVGTNYQLWLGGSPVGSVVAGTGAAITFGLQTTGGTYTVLATTVATGCTNFMTGSATVTVNPLPTAFAVTGGGSYCAGGTGVVVGLFNSQVGVNYQLFIGGLSSGSPVAGTGLALSFGLQTTAGAYTVVATNATTTCVANMTGSVTVAINALPVAQTVTGGGSYCAGGAGVAIGLANSVVGVNYQLFRGVTAITTVAGTGAAITFGSQTTAGTYTVLATTVATGCTNSMTGSATISINPLPALYTFTSVGSGAYCAGGLGVDLNLSNSDAGINYTLNRGGVPVLTLGGTGAALDFGYQSVAGVYNVTATNSATGCNTTMTGSVTISINPAPAAFAMTGGGAYCAGGAGLAVGLANSAPGVTYQLYNAGVATGSPVGGLGIAISFGTFTTAGSYASIATITATGCTSVMTGTVTVTVNPLPTAFTVTGTGSYCSGGSGLAVGLSGSVVGVNYQLFRGGIATGSAVAGTGSAISFGLQTIAGTYTVVATTVATGCTNNMTGSAIISINPLPGAFTVSGTGSYCSGGAGLHITLSGSALGINYQLYIGGVATGTPVAGTGSALDFGLQTAAGTYTVIATNATTGCTATMTGSAVITITALPTAFTVTGGGGYCTGGTGLVVGLSGSQVGVTYQLYNTFVATGTPVAGTGAAISFGLQTGAGFYTVVATNTTTTCTNNMTSGVAITLFPLPTVYNVTGGGSYCAGGTGVHVGTNSSDAGVNYQLYRGGSPLGAPVAGTGSALDFGLQTVAGLYTAVATDASTGCSSTLSGSATVSINVLPTTYNMTGGGTQCAGGVGVAVGLSNSTSGVSYQLYNTGVITGTPVAGIGAAISFGLQTAAGTYTAIATNTTTGCTNNMTGTSTIIINPLPTAYAVTGGGSYCAGGTGVSVGLANSTTGINYQLFRGATPLATIAGTTGSALNFGLQTIAGVYTIVATNSVTGCTATMSGSATVVVNALPIVYAISGGGAYCSGGTGVSVDLANSEFGVDYQLYIGGVATGSPVAGTGTSISFGLQTAAGIYTIVATNATTGCTSNMSGSVTIIVNPLPAAITGTASACEGGTTTLSDATAGGNWSSSNTTVATITGAGVVSALSAGASTISYTLPATGCYVTRAYTVNALPVVYTVTGGGSYCAGGSGLSVTLSNSEVGVNYQVFLGGVAFGSLVPGTGTPLNFLFTTAGVYTISGINSSTGCGSIMSGSATIVVNPLPAAIAGASSVCIGYTTTLSDATSGGAWSSTDATVATIDAAGLVTSVAPGTTIISYTMPVTGCGVALGFTVNAVPVVAAIGGSSSVCESATTTLTNATAGGTWASSDASVAAIDPSLGIMTGIAAGGATITYTVSLGTGCITSVTKAVTVNASPVVSPIVGSATICSGLTNTFTDATAGGVWTSGNTSVATIGTTGIATGIGAGTASISYTVTSGGCSTTRVSVITVGSVMPSSFILPASGNATLCHGNPVLMSVVSTGTLTSYQWNLGGFPIASGATDSVYTATIPGMYTCTISNGTCNVTISGVNVVNPPLPVIAVDTAGGYLYTGSFSTYQWFYNGVAIPGATTNLTPEASTGVYYVVVSDANGCTDTSAIFITPGSLYTNNTGSVTNVRIYPNPATSILNIDAPVRVFVTISTPDGRIYMDKKEAVSVNIADLADGIYLVSIYDEANTLLRTEKLVKMQ